LSFINFAAREINCKIVYYGAGLGGKTTNLQVIYQKTADQQKGKMISLATETERTLFFDFLPLDLGSVRGFKTRIHLYTVPGQVFYDASRKLILRGVDGIVFVADSQYEKMPENVEAFQNLCENLKTLKLDINEIPYVLQYNKRDLPNVAPVEYMDYLLNNRDVQVPSFTGTAHKCEGVFETLNMITRMLLQKYINQNVPQYA
jgi:mutual gliding-motility protein MglA